MQRKCAQVLCTPRAGTAIIGWMPLRADLAALPAWGFAFPGPLRDELTALALADPTFVLDDDTLVVLQRFRVVEYLTG
jgi:hypothetical protein